MLNRTMRWTLAALLALAPVSAGAATPGMAATAAQWQDKFDLAGCTMQTTGRNTYFILEPGFRQVLEGGNTRLQITVLNETKMIDGVNTRVVEEREWKDGKLYEISRNYFALCGQTRDVFYFGEDVDYYENDKVVKHDGTWHAGVKGNRPGLIMPGTPKPKMRYYQEIAPGVAMDRAEVISVSDTCKTPAGTFKQCLKVQEGSALGPDKEFKYHAPGIGLVQDEDLKLVRHGFINKPAP